MKFRSSITFIAANNGPVFPFNIHSGFRFRWPLDNAITEKVRKKRIIQDIETTSFRTVHLRKIPVEPVGAGQLVAEVRMPSGKLNKSSIIDNHDGTVCFKYEPKEEGMHELYIKYNDEYIQGSPFKFHVDAVTSGNVTAYGPGLTYGVAGEPCNFTIYTKGAGADGLSVAVEGPSKAEISCHDHKDGTVSVSYVPTAPGEYKILVKFANVNITGSPFTATITGEGRKRNQISVDHSSEVSLKIQETDVKNLNASIVAPSQMEEPCFLKKLHDGHLGISFTPREAGHHEVHVTRLGKPIQGSPFRIDVLEKEVGDASKVKVSGVGIRESKTHQNNEIIVDMRNAGYGGLSLSIEGPSKAEISYNDNEDGTLKVLYKPTEPGYYVINLKFADHHVTGSPFTIKVTGQGSNVQRESIIKQRDALPIAEVGSECKLSVKLPGTNAFDMAATVTSPSGETEDAEILDLEDCLYAIHLEPKELGVHTICVRHKNIHILGSPFQFTVGPLIDCGYHKVRAGGLGLVRGGVNVPAEFNVWTREAGVGNLSISIEGPSKAEMDFTDRKDGSCHVSYIVKEPGDYHVGIKFNDQHIPDSPYNVHIMPPASEEAKNIELGSISEESLQVNKPLAFTVHMNGARGVLDGKVISPSGNEDDCFVVPIDDEQWALRFIPKEKGIHQVHIYHNDSHIPESPFSIRIGKDDDDPASVTSYGNGLKECKTGTKTDFTVNTCKTGVGNLAVTIDGPSKVSMDCVEVEEGYKFRYTPLAPGDYFITVKFNGYHIVRSPFRVRCTGQSVADCGEHETSSIIVETAIKQESQKVDGIPRFHSNASKVTSKGMGLKKAYFHKQNAFSVNCGDAGNNLLYVSMYGPKGPCEEIFVKHLGYNLYQVNYILKDKGDHILIVKWGDEHIPGSPFRVEAS